MTAARDRSVQDTATAPSATNGTSILLTASPAAACDSAAPLSAKNIPAYAHSFTRGSSGATIAVAPSSSHVPRIVANYVG
jgi:hypothetical protein